MDNYIKLEFPSLGCNEAFARAAAGAFAVRFDITTEDLADIKTAVSEAVTNCVVHGYAKSCGIIEMKCRALGKSIEITVTDFGCGIEDVELAMQPLYSESTDEERSGMGFTVMESFMDDLKVQSEKGVGTTVIMTKNLEYTYDR